MITPPKSPPLPASLGALFDWIAPDVTPDDLLTWPPDALGMALAALQKSGAYLLVVDCNQWPPSASVTMGQYTYTWHQYIGLLGRRWRDYVTTVSTDFRPPVPRTLNETVMCWINLLFSSRDVLLADLRTPPLRDLRHALHNLIAAADEAFAGVGFRAGGPGSVYSLAAIQLNLNDGRTLGRQINSDVMIVLPKQRTPQTGMTIRTLTHNLAICWAGEVTPRWLLAASNILTPLRSEDPHYNHEAAAQADLPLNILIIPWPERVQPTQFKPAKWSLSEHNSGTYGFFSYSFGSTPGIDELEKRFQALYEAARTQTGRIDGVILPELALNGDAEVERLGRTFLKWNSSGFFIAGVGTEESPGMAGCNKACLMFKIGNDYVHREDQAKHHRWQLEQRQIEAFGLGAMLNPFVRWWEHIRLEQRKLTFMPFTPSLTATVLICEDLARQEPAGEIIRAVGPNLAVALLMDGPQLSSRWPSRYATVLADDPGSSVLTVTSLGMSQLSRPGGLAPLRVIAQWKDSKSGVREILLPEGADAIVLSLANQMTTEWTSDGRSDGGATNLLALSGVFPVTLNSGLIGNKG